MEDEDTCQNESITEASTSQRRKLDIEYFGKFISNQYEILEKTLTNLMINDLLSASNVASSWRDVSERLLRKRVDLKWHIRNSKGKIIAGHYFKNKINFQSQFVLGFQLGYSKDEVLTELMENDSYIYSRKNEDFTKGYNIPGLLDANMLLIQSSKNEIPYYTEKNEVKFLDNADVGIFFPKIEGFDVFTVFTSVYDHSFEFPFPSLKGILVFNCDGEFDALEIAFNKLLNTSSTSVALAGGIFRYVKTFSKDDNRFNQNCDIVNICFCGDNVSCHSDVLHTSEKNATDDFMQKMKAELGSFDEKKQRRIAIVIRCVARSNTKYEKSLFKQYFPNVPAFTLLSDGECGHHSAKATPNENRDFSELTTTAKKKKKHISVNYCYSVVYFFITIDLYPLKIF